MSFQTLSPDFRESLRIMADDLQKPVLIRVAGFDTPSAQTDIPQPVRDALPMPRREDVIDGVLWVGFAMDKGDYGEYKGWPTAIRYKGKLLAKTSWNSDSMNIYYKEQPDVPMKNISGEK